MKKQAYSVIVIEDDKAKDVQTFFNINDARQSFKEAVQDMTGHEISEEYNDNLIDDGVFDTEAGIKVNFANHFILIV